MKRPGAAWCGIAILIGVAAAGCRTASPEAAPTPPAIVPLPVEKPAAVPASEPPAGPFKNTIRWTTASEVDNFGFDVFRSTAEEGPFEKINPEVIEGAGTTDEPTSYRYVDDTIDPRQTYFYYVESISMSGDREQFTPVAKVLPKAGAEGDTGAEEGSGGTR